MSKFNLAEARVTLELLKNPDEFFGVIEKEDLEPLLEHLVWLHTRERDRDRSWDPEGFGIYLTGNDSVAIDDRLSGDDFVFPTLDDAEDFARCVLSATATARARKEQS